MDKRRLLKANSLIGIEADIELGRAEQILLNTLIMTWQKNKTDLFLRQNQEHAISLSVLAELMELKKSFLVSKEIPSRFNQDKDYIENLFDKLMDTKVSLRNCVIPKIDPSGQLIFVGEMICLEKVSSLEANILEYYKKKENPEYNIYTFRLTPIFRGLLDYKTLIEKGNGIGYTPLSLKKLNAIKSPKSIRFYEVIMREHNKGNSAFIMTYEEMGKIIYEPTKKRINQTLKRIAKDLEELVTFTKSSTSSTNYICLNFKVVE